MDSILLAGKKLTEGLISLVFLQIARQAVPETRNQKPKKLPEGLISLVILQIARQAVPETVPETKVGAVCVSSARTDLCGVRLAMIVPTATQVWYQVQAGIKSSWGCRVKVPRIRSLMPSSDSICARLCWRSGRNSLSMNSLSVSSFLN